MVTKVVAKVTEVTSPNNYSTNARRKIYSKQTGVQQSQKGVTSQLSQLEQNFDDWMDLQIVTDLTKSTSTSNYSEGARKLNLSKRAQSQQSEERVRTQVSQQR